MTTYETQAATFPEPDPIEVSGAITNEALMAMLTPTAEELYARHISQSKPWYPHEYVPYSLGQDFEPGYVWNPNEPNAPTEAVRSALFVNLMTEDNLPYYFHTLDAMFGDKGIWKTWSHRWTAEEARHSIAIRDYLTVTRALDPRAVEDGRMQQMSGGEVPHPPTAVDGFVYVALQELATRVAHRNTGRVLQDTLKDNPVGKAGYELLGRVATDENFHFLFYRDLTAAALEIAPELVLPALARQIKDFEMPGTGIEGFEGHAQLISDAGIFGFTEMKNQVYDPTVIKAWKVDRFKGSSVVADEALERIGRRLKAIGRASLSEQKPREEYAARQVA